MSTSEPALETLMLGAATGDQGAFAAVYDATASMVYGLALRIVRDNALAEEVAQEVYVQAWRTAPRFDPGRGSVRGWLATMARRKAIDVVRRSESSRRRDALVGSWMDRPFDEPAESVGRSEVGERVRQAFSALSDVQQQAVALTYFQGLTYQEVAEATGTPLGTVKTRMRSALAKLGNILVDEYD